MSATGLVRTQYWNVSGPNPTPRTGQTSRAESRTDFEGYLLASDAARNSAVYGWGVADGLQVSATAGAVGVTVAVGVAFNIDGQVIVLGDGGLAIVDPLVGSTGVQNIPTVPVPATGVVFDTTGLTGPLLLTITGREVEQATAGLLLLRQAPWLRLVDPTTFVEDGLQLVLATVSLGAGGGVDAVDPGSRRLVGVPASRLELRVPRLAPTGLAVGQIAVAELTARTDGGADLNLLAPAGTVRRGLSLIGSTADVDLGAGLRVSGGTALGAGLTVAGPVEAVGDVVTHSNITAGGDLAVTEDLQVGGTTQLNTLTVQSTAEVLGELTVQGPVETTVGVLIGGDLTVQGTFRGQQGTVEQLAVHGGAIIGAGANGALTTRHIDGKSDGNDSPDALYLNWNTGKSVNVGGGQPADLIVSRNVLVHGRVGVQNDNPAFQVDVTGTVCATVFCNPSDLRLKTDVVQVQDVLGRLAKVRAVSFTPLQAVDEPPRKHAGVVAQELVEAFPELVIPMGSGGLLAVDYAGLAGVLVGAVNELRSAAAALTDRVADLERCGGGGNDVLG